MSDLSYPWPWAIESLQGFFALHIPWLADLRRGIGLRRPACLLLPEAAGRLADWSWWLTEYLWQHDRAEVDRLPAEDLDRGILDHFLIEEPRGCEYGSAPWREAALTQHAQRVIHAEPRLVVFADERGDCWERWDGWLRAQQRVNVPLLCPIVLSRAPPVGGSWHVVRFGAAQVLGNLHALEATPDQDPARWTRLMHCLTVLWECSCLPALADELWGELLPETSLLTAPDFDARVRRVLQGFAAGSAVAGAVLSALSKVRPWARPKPERRLALQPDEWPLWHAGILAWHSPGFDLTPLAARVLAPQLRNEDDAESVRRRRLNNQMLGRWLSGWATAVERGLRLAGIRAGQQVFRAHLEGRRPYRSGYGSRWAELTDRRNDEAPASPVDAAELIDLVEFVGQQQTGTPLQRSEWHKCRQTRNNLVHDRGFEADAVLTLGRAVDWLRSQGLM